MPFSFSVEYADALWLLLLLPLVIFMARRGGSGPVVRKSSRRLSIALRLLIVTLLIASIANLQLTTPSDKVASVFLVDVSDSMGENGRSQALEFTRKALQGMKDNQQGGIVVFGQDAAIQRLVSNEKQLSTLMVSPNTGYSNLAEAVRLGTALLPGDARRRLVLVSDGNQNVDEVRDAAKLSAASGVPVDVVTVKRKDGPEVSLSNLQVPGNLRQGEEFALKVAVDSNFAGPGRLQILEDGKVISEKAVELKTGANLFTEQLIAKARGSVNYTARVVASGDTIAQNNENQSYSVVKGKPRALLVEGHPDQKEAANLEAALKQSDIEPTVISPDRFPPLKELREFDSVMLVNVPANKLTETNMKELQSYVKDLGKGMVMVGGEESYGMGGYSRTPLEEMLPVDLQLPAELRTPSVAMVLVIDRSGSMVDGFRGYRSGSAKSKLELAKDAAYLAVQQLGKDDQVGVVTFDTQARWQIPLTKVEDPTRFSEPISRIGPGGGTYIYSGFAPAVTALKSAKASSKHIIILTDGQDAGRTNYDPLLEESNNAKITVSTIGLGADVNSSFLQNLAERGGGRYNFVSDPDNLPAIFAKEARLAARSYIVEEDFTPAVADSSAIIKRIASTPALKGYVATKSKPNTTLALVTARKEPLLAHWQYGLGRVAAWTSDAKGRWASDWLSWNDFPRFWSQMVRWTVAENESGGIQVQTKMVGNRIVVMADALSVESQYLNGLSVKAKVAGSGGGPEQEITLVQTAPGHYEGGFTPDKAGSYSVSVQGSGQAVTVTGSPTTLPANLSLSQTVGAVAPYSPEYRQLGSNEPLMKEIASLSGGRVLSSPEETFRGELGSAFERHNLWPWLLLLAVLLFPLDIAVRRTRFSPLAIYRGYKDYRQTLRVQRQSQHEANAVVSAVLVETTLSEPTETAEVAVVDNPEPPPATPETADEDEPNDEVAEQKLK